MENNSKANSGMRKIVRVVNTDLDGEKPIIRAIRNIKGISFTMSKAIVYALGLDPNRKIGDLSEEEIEKLEDAIKNPKKYGIPPYLLNRRRDPETGEDYHISGEEVHIRMKMDIKKMIELRTYRGWRHKLGQPVRGQKTRSHFRSSGRTVGVKKPKVSGKK
ncbi:MAG: 30S ribosomal protein S13 [Candidatus Aenigmarchaeota archaeon]|nr:30S ribosomal protein S13 [Candidatus Aenigmarchaeota archaeon]